MGLRYLVFRYSGLLYRSLKMQTCAALLAVGMICAPNTGLAQWFPLPRMVYQGGAVFPNVRVQAVYLGADWLNNLELVMQRQQLDSFLADIVKSEYMDGMSEYGIGRGTYLGSYV